MQNFRSSAGDTSDGVDKEALLLLIRRLMEEEQLRHAQQQNAILQLYNELTRNVKQLRERVGNIGVVAGGGSSSRLLGLEAGSRPTADGFPSLLQNAAAASEKREDSTSYDIASLQRKVWGRTSSSLQGRGGGKCGETEETQSNSTGSMREEGVTPQRRPGGSRSSGGNALPSSMSPARSDGTEENLAKDILDDMSDEFSTGRAKAEALYNELMSQMMSRSEDSTAGSKVGSRGIGPLDAAVVSQAMDMHALRSTFNAGDVSLNTPSGNHNNGGVSADVSGLAEESASLETLRALKELPCTTSVCAEYKDGRPQVKFISSSGAEDESLGLSRHQPYHVLVEFKRHRAVQFESDSFVAPGRYVVVAADRGEDLGLVICTWCESFNTPPKGRGAFSTTPTRHYGGLMDENPLSVKGIRLLGAELPSVLRVCRGTVLRNATESEVSQLHFVQAELERRAIEVCEQRVLERKVPMVLVDAEYQFDSKKLTFFYEAQQRTDFRELVRDLYKSFRARIWMEMVEDSD